MTMESENGRSSSIILWVVCWWLLFEAWVLGAALNMAGVHGGFFTNYLADVAFPPWAYIYFRGLYRTDRRPPQLALVGQWFGKSRHLTAAGILLVGILTELKTLYWPNGPITGTFDPYDIAAYSIGILVCWLADPQRK